MTVTHCRRCFPSTLAFPSGKPSTQTPFSCPASVVTQAPPATSQIFADPSQLPLISCRVRVKVGVMIRVRVNAWVRVRVRVRVRVWVTYEGNRIGYWVRVRVRVRVWETFDGKGIGYRVW